MNSKIKEVTLVPLNNDRLISLCGPLDENLKYIEQQLQIVINRHNNLFKLTGLSSSVEIAAEVVRMLYFTTDFESHKMNDITLKKVYLTIQEIQRKYYPIYPNISNKIQDISSIKQNQIMLKCRTIKPWTINQVKYISDIFNYDITFGIGPSGTGKTYLAIAAAVDLLERQKNEHIILSRPAIEAGEKLGFLPGDFNQKTDPYIQPLYDALCDVLGYERMEQLIKKNMIEVIPLAYMRGRTFNNSVIILDESQNTTITQMKMFLTRIGFNSVAIITGDTTQVDLPSHQESGLAHAIKILASIKNISFRFFNKEDSVRHTIVTKIIDAYESYEIQQKNCK